MSSVKHSFFCGVLDLPLISYCSLCGKEETTQLGTSKTWGSKFSNPPLLLICKIEIKFLPHKSYVYVRKSLTIPLLLAASNTFPSVSVMGARLSCASDPAWGHGDSMLTFMKPTQSWAAHPVSPLPTAPQSHPFSLLL